MRASFVVFLLLIAFGAAADDAASTEDGTQGSLTHGITLARVVLERGDVVLQTAFNGGGFIDGTPPPERLAFYDDFGTEKKLAFPELTAVRGIFAPEPERVLVTTSSRAVYVVRDGVRAEAIRGLSLQSPGEIVPMRSGDLLIAESFTSHTKPRIVQIDASGRIVRDRTLTDVPAEGMHDYYGVGHMELLADQCTVVWNSADFGLVRLRAQSLRVRRYDICTGTTLPDLLTLPFDSEPGSLRQLPGGDLLIATGNDVRRYDLGGTLRATYPVPATFVALTPDASGFRAANRYYVYHVDFAAPQLIAAQFPIEARLGLGIAVVGEWRSALQFPKRRAGRK